MSIYHFVHRQLLLGPVVLPLTESVDDDTTTEQAYEDFNGVVTCRFYVEAREVTDGKHEIRNPDPDLWLTLEIENKLRGQLARYDPSTSWSVASPLELIEVFVDEVEEDPEKVVLFLPHVVDEALKVALDEYRSLGIVPRAIADKARARAQALGTPGNGINPDDFPDEDEGSGMEGIAYESGKPWAPQENARFYPISHEED